MIPFLVSPSPKGDVHFMSMLRAQASPLAGHFLKNAIESCLYREELAKITARTHPKIASLAAHFCPGVETARVVYFFIRPDVIKNLLLNKTTLKGK
jgi:hypothetical protein